ncbi:MAG: hypothetical protein ABI416_05210 [Ginsengibacter sp.]
MKSILFSPSAIRAFILLLTITGGFATANTCQGQSVVGKWKREGIKLFTENSATGKQEPVSAQAQQQYDKAEAARGYHEILEMKSDNTYTITVSTASSASPVIHNGKYSLSGRNLDMNIPEVNHEKTNITLQSITSSKMVWDMLFKGKLMEIRYAKM